MIYLEVKFSIKIRVINTLLDRELLACPSSNLHELCDFSSIRQIRQLKVVNSLNFILKIPPTPK
jgi:hypothetical protein